MPTIVHTMLVRVGSMVCSARVGSASPIPTRQLLAGAVVAGVAWQVLQAVGGLLVGHYLRHTSQVFDRVRDRPCPVPFANAEPAPPVDLANQQQHRP